MSNKIVYNNCYGGFSISPKAAILMGLEQDDFGDKYESYHERGFERHDSRLVAVVEDLGAEAGGRFANLKIATIKGNLYRIGEYDGMEWVETPETQDWVEIDE